MPQKVIYFIILHFQRLLSKQKICILSAAFTVMMWSHLPYYTLHAVRLKILRTVICDNNVWLLYAFASWVETNPQLSKMFLLKNEITPPPPTLVKVGKSYSQTQRIKNNVPFFTIDAEGDQATQHWIPPRLSCLQNVDLIFPRILKFAGVFCCFVCFFFLFVSLWVFVCFVFKGVISVRLWTCLFLLELAP